MSVSTPQEQPAEGQDPQSQTPAPEAPPAPAPTGDGPWASDLSQFEDPAIRSQVDSFLRTKVQPYNTKLEQQVAQAAEATQLWNQLNESPVDTYVAMTEQMFGAEASQQVLTQLQQLLGDGQQEAQQPVTEQAPQQPIDPRLAAVIEYVEAQQNNNYYEQEINRLATEHPEVDPDLVHPFIAAAGGDFNQAVELYNNWLAQYGDKYGTATPTPPPAVLGSDTNATQSSATPVEPKKQTMDEAINDFMAEQRANRGAPPVGSV